MTRLTLLLALVLIGCGESGPDPLPAVPECEDPERYTWDPQLRTCMEDPPYEEWLNMVEGNVLHDSLPPDTAVVPDVQYLVHAGLTARCDFRRNTLTIQSERGHTFGEWSGHAAMMICDQLLWPAPQPEDGE